MLRKILLYTLLFTLKSLSIYTIDKYPIKTINASLYRKIVSHTKK